MRKFERWAEALTLVAIAVVAAGVVVVMGLMLMTPPVPPQPLEVVVEYTDSATPAPPGPEAQPAEAGFVDASSTAPGASRFPVAVLRGRLQEGLAALQAADKALGVRAAATPPGGILLGPEDSKAFETWHTGLKALAARAAAPKDSEVADLVGDLEALETAWGRLRPALDRAVRQAEQARRVPLRPEDEGAAEKTPNWGPPR